MDISDITVLCCVVDNYGDIGVAHRLCHELVSLTGGKCTIRLVINGLDAYSSICPQVQMQSVQTIDGITVLDWNDAQICRAHFASRPPVIILQCFQCTYPVWLEEMLFSDELSRDVYIIDIDYLTAQPWAEDFHQMPSLTRRAKVHKTIFMPGFTAKTGGLLLSNRLPLHHAPHTAKSILVFGYDRDYTPLVTALSRLCTVSRARTADDYIVYSASGAGQKAFIDAWQNAGKPFTVKVLPFVRQEEWDKMLLNADIAFVRGEDSMAGAALSGVPYIWEAYRQDGGEHINKINALLRLMQPYFDSAHYKLLAAVWNLWNGGMIPRDGGDVPISSIDVSNYLYEFMRQYESFKPLFARYAHTLADNGDMATHLIDYIRHL